jgi:hypothetical protein
LRPNEIESYIKDHGFYDKVICNKNDVKLYSKVWKQAVQAAIHPTKITKWEDEKNKKEDYDEKKKE